MGLFDKLLNRKEETAIHAIETQTAPLMICAPFSGSAMKLEDIGDPVFSQGVLGPGCGMEPAEETVYAPFDGTISQTTDTKHAVGITSEDGIELLIHVGMDTVDMAGRGFACLVKEGQTVRAGQPVMTFSMADIKAAGHPATTAVVVTNGDAFAGLELLVTGEVEHGTPVIRLSK